MIGEKLYIQKAIKYLREGKEEYLLWLERHQDFDIVNVIYRLDKMRERQTEPEPVTNLTIF
jgi:hypothetical protein